MSNCRLSIRVSEQELDLFIGTKLVKTYKISTAKNGLGTEKNSYKTPTGRMKIAKKIGAGSELGTVFRARVATGEIWSTDDSNPLKSSSEDLILTRILWLEGCEPQNSNTLERYVYLHGTNQEQLLGTPASHGCIRLSNEDIVELYDKVDEGTPVEVIS